jgi:hypothetical protein
MTSLDLRDAEAACDQKVELRVSGTLESVHLSTVNRYREVVMRLEGRL